MKNILLIVGLTLAVVFTACKKDEQNDDYAIYEFFKENSKQMQSFNIQGGQEQTITTVGGMQITFYPNSIIDFNGNVVTGDITIKVKEIYSKKDMILNYAPTVSDNKLLVSGGEFKIITIKPDVIVIVNPNAKPTVKIPANGNVNAMSLFRGQIAGPLPDSSFGAVYNWVLDSTQVALLADQYNFEVPAFTWLNCDYFYMNGLYDGDSIRLNLPEGFDYTNTSAFISFNGINALYKFPFGNQFVAYQVPKNANVRLITMGKKGDDFYFSNTPAITNGNTYNATPVKKSLNDIFTELNNLP